MGRKSKPSLAAPSSIPNDEEGRLKMALDLKKQGNERFARREFAKALQLYDAALRLVPESHAKEAAVLHNNKAACHLKSLRFKDTVRECTHALQLDPEFSKAVSRRAKALEMSGNHAGALEDYRKLAAMPGGGGAEVEKRIEALEQAVKEGRGVTKLAARSQQQEEAAQRRAVQQKRAVVQEIKLVHGEDTKVCRFQGGEVTYALLQEQVAQKFPGLGPARLSYVDREGERVVVSSRDDVLAALEVALMQAVEQGGPRLAAMPPARLNVEPCAEAEVPPPPPEEAKQLEQMRQMRKYIDELQERQLKARMEALQQQASAGSELVEIDSWVVQLAQLVREQLNIDPDRHVDLQQEGWEHVSQALDKVLVSDEAVQLFEQGIGKFKEVVALGHLNWGHAHLAIARKFMDEMAKAGTTRAKADGDATYARVLEEFGKAEAKMGEAMGYKPDFYDGAVGLGQLWFERAKLEAGMLMTNPATTPEAADGAPKGEDEKVYRACLERLETRFVASSMPLFERAVEWHDKGLGMARGAVGGTDPEKMETDAQQLRNQSNILAGNVLYEVSQIKAATGDAGWRTWLDKAIGRFREASCESSDIIQALQNHVKTEELQDLIAEVRPAEEPKAEKADEAKAEGSKGPSLPKKK